MGFAGGCTSFMDSRSRMNIDPINSTPTMTEWSMSGFHQPGRHRAQQARNAVRCSTSRIKGELHSSKNHLCPPPPPPLPPLPHTACLPGEHQVSIFNVTREDTRHQLPRRGDVEGWLSDQQLIGAHLEEDTPNQALDVHFLQDAIGRKGGGMEEPCGEQGGPRNRQGWV